MCVAGHAQKRPAIRSALRFAETLHSGCIAGQFCICARKGGRPPHKRVKPVQGQTHAAQSRPDMVAVPEVRLFMRKAVPPRCLVSIRLQRQIDRGPKQPEQAWRTGSRGDENSPGTRAAPPKLAAHSAADAACIPAHSPETSRIPPPRRRARPCAARFSDRSCLRPNQPSPVPLFLRGLTALRPVPQVLPAKTAAQCAAPDIKRGAPLPEQDFLRLPHSAQQRTARAAESAAAPKARIAASG